MSSGPIQVIPPGLLGFLNLKSQGQNPSMLGDTYEPVVQMFEWLLMANWTSIQFAGLITAGTTGFYTATPTPTIVPDREWWYVHDSTASIGPLGVGETAQASIAIRISQNAPLSNHILTFGNGQYGNGGTAGTTLALPQAHGFWANPGALVGIDVSIADVTVNKAFNQTVRYTRLPF